MAYFHILVELVSQTKKDKKESLIKEHIFNILDTDKDIKIVRDIVLPYITGSEFFVNGRSLTKPDIAKLYITKTDQTTQVLLKDFYATLSPNIFVVASDQDVAFSNDRENVTNDILSDARTMANRNGMAVAGPVNRSDQTNPISQKITQNFHSPAMVQNSPVNSSQNMTINTNQVELFEKMLEKALEISNNQDIIKNIEEMKLAIASKNKETFLDKYTNFISSAADHMTVFLPFIPALKQLLLG